MFLKKIRYIHGGESLLLSVHHLSNEEDENHPGVYSLVRGVGGVVVVMEWGSMEMK